MIGYIQLMYLTNKEIIRKEKEIFDLEIYYNKNKGEMRQVTLNKNITLNNIIGNYYMTDVNIRLSKNLMITGNTRKEMKIKEAGIWKNKKCI